MATEIPLSTSNSSYHVFLSFSEDTSKKFTSHLYTALDHAGFRAFRREEDINRGENMELELKKAIQSSRVSIVVFSKEFASSSQCLDELVMILNRKHQVLPIFYDVEPSAVRNVSGRFGKELTSHEQKFQAEAGERKIEWTDKIKGWKEALTEIANLAGMTLQQEAGNESKFIRKIVKVVEGKLSRVPVSVDSQLVGINHPVQQISFWLREESIDVSVVAITGMGGIGKTTIAKLLYNENYFRFEGSCFLGNIREISEQHNGLVHLQQQLLSSILTGRKPKINSVDEGIFKIKDALCCKKVLIILDDVDEQKQLDALLGEQDWFSPSSKIIITTRRESFLRAHETWKVHRAAKLVYRDSIELFSWHAFGQKYPMNHYTDISEKMVKYCDGLPLALKILGSSLRGLEPNIWKSQLERLKGIPNMEVIEKLRISYDSLQDDEDKNLFLHIACFFIGDDKNSTIEILDACDFHTEIGIQNLIDRCLLTIDRRDNKLMMHHLVREMGRAVVHQESPKEAGKRSRLWRNRDSFKVLREKKGTSKIEGLTLDMHLVDEDKNTKMAFGANRKRCFQELQKQSLSNIVPSSFKRYCFGFPYWNSIGTAQAYRDVEALETDAFDEMHNLKLLQLKFVQFNGSYTKFPIGLRWLCWHGFPLPSLPSNFHLEGLIILELPYNFLKDVANGGMCFKSLKVLNLSHSQCSSITLDASMVPSLKKLILNNCRRLVEVPESIGHLERLVLLDLSHCTSLTKLPRSITMLKYLEELDLSGCPSLENFKADTGNIKSLTVLDANGNDVKMKLSTIKEVKAWHPFSSPWQPLKPRNIPKISRDFLPVSLVRLQLRKCNLTEEDFPKDLSYLTVLREMDISKNPISSIPACIKGHTGVEDVILTSCHMLRSVTSMPHWRKLVVSNCHTLEKINLQLSDKQHCLCDYGFNPNLVEFTTVQNNSISWVTKVEPLVNVDGDMINNFGLTKFASMSEPTVVLFSAIWSKIKELPPQLIREDNWIGTFLPGSKIPKSFNFRSMGSSISIVVPSCPVPDLRIQGLSLGFVYQRKYSFTVDISKYLYMLEFTIINKTKNRSRSSYSNVHGVPKSGEDMTWLLYYADLEMQFEAGDELDISIRMDALRENKNIYEVKEVGVCIVYKEQEEKIAGLCINEKGDPKHMNVEMQLPDLCSSFRRDLSLQ